MIKRYFTVEEENLIYIFDTSCRRTLITELSSAIPYFDERDLCGIAQSVLKTLNAMTDEEFATIIFIPDYIKEDV